MKVERLLLAGVIAGLVAASPLPATVMAQPAVAAAQRIWENDRIRVDRVVLAPGETFSDDSPNGSVVVFLSADLDGRVPASEAVWHDPGVVTMENRGGTRFEAVLVALKSSTPRGSGISAPEAIRAAGLAGIGGAYDTAVSDMIRARNLIVNDRISVTKERYASGVSLALYPLHFHPQDAVVVYLHSGYTWPGSLLYGPERVRRGEVHVVPGNVFHTTGNAGSDPLEFLLIVPA